MNNRSLVKLSNIIGVVSIVALVYWVFIFTTITVFGFKVFKENITQTFFLSILGILALMFGALMINIMFNLTRIAEKHNQDVPISSGGISRNKWIIFILSFPIIFALLFCGDYLSAKKKEQMLIESVESIIANNPHRVDRLTNYKFDEKWIADAVDTLKLYKGMDKHFPNVNIIAADEIEGSRVFLNFNAYNDIEERKKKAPLKIQDFIWSTTSEERVYLNSVFDGTSHAVRFSASDGKYELFYPYVKDGKTIVLYFSEYQRYGKLGSS